MIKQILGYVFMYSYIVSLVTLGLPLLLRRSWAFLVIKAWGQGLLWVSKVFWGIDVKFEGEPLPEKGAIIASKHSSVLEIIALCAKVNNPIFFLKSSLLYIPFLNLFLLRTGQLAVRRWLGGNRSLFSKAVQRLKDCNIVIFPEGTRVAIDKTEPFKSGVVVLAKQADCPIVPVSANTGVLWARRGLIKKAGTAVLRVLPVLKVDNLRESLKKLEEVIVTDSRKLVEEMKPESK